MLYNVRLNEFTEDQLEFILDAVNDKINSINFSFEMLDMWEDGTIKSEGLEQTQKDFDTAILWKVQLENAKSDLKQMVTNNQ